MPTTNHRLRILFLGDGDALISPMAAALLNEHAGDIADATSAGLARRERHPLLAIVMAELDIELDETSRALEDLASDQGFDLVITVTPDARRASTPRGRAADPSRDEHLTIFVGTPIRLHWTFAPLAEDDEPLAALRRLRDEVKRHVRTLIDQGYLDALATERRRTRKLVDAIDTGIIVHDDHRRIYLFNEAAERVTGKRREEVLGRDCHEIFPPDGICGSRCAFKKRQAEPFTKLEYQVAFTSADGTGRLVRMQSSPMEVIEGRPAEIVAQVTDVTEIDNLRWRLRDRQALHGMVGESPAMQGVFELIRQVAASDYPVLITGESGTGKELAANAIHAESRRAEGPFVPINCGALPEHILESELFGHVRGAFTGAIRDKKGRFELANGGTIFLDEVGELTPAFQVKLLRVLQEMRFERVGGERTIGVDVRVISATNRDLRAMVATKEFREDLFYRLCVVPIALPALRDRRHDIPLLASHILERIRAEMGREELRISQAAMDLLLAHRWPGNVRELINALQFAAVRGGGEEIIPAHLPPEVRLGATAPEAARGGAAFLRPEREPRRGRRKLDVETVVSALAQTSGNKVRAAKLLGVGRATLYRFLNENPLPSTVKTD